MIKKKVYDVFDTTNMMEPYRTQVQEPMRYVRARYEEEGWELVHMTDDYSIWVKVNPTESEIEMNKVLEEIEA